MIKLLSPRYDFSPMRANRSVSLADGFLVEFCLEPGARDFPGELFRIPGSLSCVVRNLPEGQEGGTCEEEGFDRLQNYRIARQSNRPCPILEATLNLFSEEHPGWTSIRAGVPFECIPKGGAGVFAVVYTGVHLMITCDGKLLDENYPVGDPAGSAVKIEGVSPVLKDISLTCSRARPLRRFVATKRAGAIQYYMPDGFNAWVGDVVPYFRDGLFHVFYLADRRHHGSRFGTGAHCFAHLSSPDLVDWTEHEPAIELEHQWESCGTGIPFFHKGKLHFGYGLHTARVIEEEKTISPLLRAGYEKTGAYAAVSMKDYPDRYQSGATYAVSGNGINFKKSNIVFHTAENPSIYATAGGSLLMFARGTWKADAVDGPWTCADPVFPAGGPGTPMRNTLECPSRFEWNGYQYLVMGLTGFWSGRTGGSFTDSAAKGYDMYDGLIVPMAAPFRDNRMIIAGWVEGIGWGSALVLRELVQYPGGRLGTKWLGEAMPPRRKTIRAGAAPTLSRNFETVIDAGPTGPRYYEMTVNPGNSRGRFAVRFKSVAEPGESCELQLLFDRERAQFGPFAGRGMAEPVNSLREDLKMREQGDSSGWRINSPNAHFRARDFCIEHVDAMRQAFALRICMHWNKKIGATIIDVEIAGRRTLITNRAGFRPDSVSCAADGDKIAIENLEISEAVIPQA